MAKNNAILIVTKKGMGKVTTIDQFRVAGRGGKGVAAFKVTPESGPVVAAVGVNAGADDKVLISTAQGMGILIKVEDITPRSRTAGGVRLMTLAEGDSIVNVSV